VSSVAEDKRYYEKVATELSSQSDVESYVLGAIIAYPDEWAVKMIERVTPDLFTNKLNRVICRAVARLFDSKSPIGPLSVFLNIEESGELSSTFGDSVRSASEVFREHLVKMSTFSSPATNVEYYWNVLVERSRRRRLAVSGDKIQRMATDGEHTSLEVGAYAQEVADFAMASVDDEKVVHVASLIDEELDRIDKVSHGYLNPPGISTGFDDLDGLIGGFHRGDYVVIGARPSVGKTALCLDLIRSMEIPTMLFSIEMGRHQVVERLLSGASGVPLYTICAGRLGPSSQQVVEESSDQLVKLPLWIDASKRLTTRDVYRRIRRLSGEHDISMVMIDYVQLMSHHDRHDNRQQELTAVSRDLKIIAGEFNVALCVFSQLSRPDRSLKKVRKPRLEDLRDSGAFEQDADVVMFLHNPKEGEEEKPYALKLAKREHERSIKLIVAKQRNGPTGSVDLTFVCSTTTFISGGKEEVKDEPDF